VTSLFDGLAERVGEWEREQAEEQERRGGWRRGAGTPRLAEVQMGRSKMPQQGHVKWYNPDKGFGFITLEEGGDVFVHRSAIGARYGDLREGQRVDFDVVDGPKGPQAQNVEPLD
jgi:CspA family cold shock protein